jgi:queuine tRNA-ribosyltransferase
LFDFKLLATDGSARRGVITTDHGSIETPGFFAVATRAALKGLDPLAAERAGVQALIVNSYHLQVHPGPEAVARAGGLHPLMGWKQPLATDSGGFQVFSLRHGQVADEVKGRRRLPAVDDDGIQPVRVDEDGAEFRSYLGGAWYRFTPESNMRLQQQLGADIVFTLDECTPLHVPADYTRAATERNLRWAGRCLDAFAALGMGQTQALYGITHGGIYPELRRASAAAVAAMPFQGLAIGDCLGATKQDWYAIVELVCPLLPAGRPRHLLGVGEPDDLIEGVMRGVDTFDCAMPTRIARHGQALHPSGRRFRLDLAAAERGQDDDPILDGCRCLTCTRFSRAYLHHLVKAHEALAVSLLAEHNLHYTVELLARVREAISLGRLADLRRELLPA